MGPAGTPRITYAVATDAGLKSNTEVITDGSRALPPEGRRLIAGHAMHAIEAIASASRAATTAHVRAMVHEALQSLGAIIDVAEVVDAKLAKGETDGPAGPA